MSEWKRMEHSPQAKKKCYSLLVVFVLKKKWMTHSSYRYCVCRKKHKTDSITMKITVYKQIHIKWIKLSALICESFYRTVNTNLE